MYVINRCIICVINLGMIIDWESLTKSDKPLNARQTMDKYYPQLQSKINSLLKKMGL